MTLDTVASRDRLPSLTGLRFWAALLVVLYHLSHGIGRVPVVSDLVWFGRTGVTFFFVLSGFVLTWTYLDARPRLTTFWWRRLARIWPMLAVSSVLVVAVSYAATGRVDVGQAVSMLTLVQAWRLEWLSSTNGSWSLSVEAFFYAVFPLLLAAVATRVGRRSLWVAVLASLLLLWASFLVLDWDQWRFDYEPVVRLPQFVLGVLCATRMRRGGCAPVPLPVAVALVVGYHVALLGWAAEVDPLSRAGAYSGSQWWAAPLFALLVMAAAQADLDGSPSWLRGPTSLRLGHWSYSWYLVHGVVIEIWLGLGPRAYGLDVVPVEWLLLLAGSLAAAGLLYTLVENPAERRLRSLPLGRNGGGRSDTMSPCQSSRTAS